MEVCIKNTCNDCLKISTIKSANILRNSLELSFGNAMDSFSAFNKMRDFGIQCSHAGSDAPDGPMVMLFNLNSNGFNFQFM